MKLAILPDEHVKKSFESSSLEYKKTLGTISNLCRVSQRELHTAILQSIYNTHLRTLEHVRTKRKVKPLNAALPLVTPSKKTIISTIAHQADNLPTSRENARKLLQILEKETQAAKQNRSIASALVCNKNKPLLAIDENRIYQAIIDINAGEMPSTLVGIIARETFLGYSVNRIHSFNEKRSIQEQVKLEDAQGAAKFQKEYPKLAERHFEQDFAPLLEIIRRRISLPKRKLIVEK